MKLEIQIPDNAEVRIEGDKIVMDICGSDYIPRYKSIGINLYGAGGEDKKKLIIHAGKQLEISSY